MNRQTIIFVLVILAIIYVFFVTYLIAKAIRNKSNKQIELIKAIASLNFNNYTNKEENLIKKPIESYAPEISNSQINTNYQTDFFIQSAEHAKQVLNTKVILEQYKYGNWMDLTKLDDVTKASIIIAIQYMSIEPIQARANEQQYRTISEIERVPLWMVILHEAIKKVIIHKPNANQESFLEFNQQPQNQNDNIAESKIIPIYKVA